MSTTTGAAPAAAAAAAAAAENVARRVAEVSIDVVALQGVQGTIKVKHAKRRVTGNAAAAAAAAANGSGAQPLGGQVSEGPQEIVAQARQVMNVTLTDREAPAGPFNNIQVFFYDEWAERLDGVLQRGMRLTISGPPEIVREHTGSQDHFYALVIAPQTLLGGGNGGGVNGAHTLTLAIRPAGGGAAAGGPVLELTQGMDAGVVAQRTEAFQSALTNAAAATARSGAAAGRGGAGGGGGSKRGPTQYAYTELGDLVLPRFKGREVNVYGVVAGFTQPRRTAGTDHMCSLLLVHPSRATQPRKLFPPPNMPPPGGQQQQQQQQQGEFEVEQVHPMQLVMRGVVVCNVFRTDLAWLPRPLQVGEIVRLHRVKVNEFQNNVQLVCNRHAQFLLVRRRPLSPGAAPSAAWVEGEWERVASSETHSFTEQDRQTIPQLWAWAHEQFLPHASLLDRFSPGPRTVEQVRKRLHNLPWRPRTAASGQAGAEGEENGEKEEPPAQPPPYGQQQQQGDDRQVGDFVGLVLARPGADSVVLWDGTDAPVPSATAQLFPAAVVRACHAALAAAHAHQGEGAGEGEGQGPWVEACEGSAAEAAEQAVPSVEVLGPAMREAGRLEVLLPSVHRWRFEGMAASGQLAPGTWVRLRHLEVQEVGVLGPLGGGAGQWQYQQQQQQQPPQGTTQVSAAGMNASLNALPPYSLDVQRVACRFLARQRQRTIPTCLMPFYHRGHPHLTGLPRAYVVEALGSTAPATFALRVRIAGFWPKDLRRACVPQPPTQPTGAQDQQWTFFFTLRLGDETGALDALVCGGGADFFLGDTPRVRACDLSQPANAPALQELQRLLGKRVAEGKAYDLLVQSCLMPPAVAGGGRAVKRFRVLAIPDVRSN